ncbi:hypothetical protein MAM1_0009d00995 [Mucor ambiguus]|uniref:Ras GEF n=1 Tax=Mucor ambiguus TaxID=91626 RepID=A0A0C9MET8_9FUNG|nr:hypothetical protein MAM1_0009d00995 [Mucor ambiguus]
MEDTNKIAESDDLETEEEAYIKETKRIIKQLESIIFKRNQNLEICLWRTFDSTIDILFIFAPKLSSEAKDAMKDHVTTVINATTLLSSVIKVLLSKFQRNETTVVETLVALAIIQSLYQLVKSLLFVFLVNEKQHGSSRKRQSAKLITPPLTPDTTSSFQQQQQQQQQQQIVDQHEFDLSFYQGGMQHVTRVGTDKSSGKIKSNYTNNNSNNNNNDTVGKRFIRSVSTLKKSQTATVQDELDMSQPTRQKIDQERVLLQSPKESSAATNANVHKGSLRLFFTGGLNKKVNKNAKSSTTSHIKDIFEINNELDHSNQRNSVQTLKSPYKRNIHIRTNDAICSSDSGCFTTASNSTSNIVHTTTSIQKEYAEPIFINQKQIKPNRSESDLLQMLKPSTSSSSAQWFNSKKKQLLKKSSFLDKEKEKEKIYNIPACDEDDEILRHAKEKGKEGSILHISEDGQDVLVMEMVSNKLQVLAGTLERLFMKLADEACQDLDYVDTYILSHLFFTNSFELLENLMARFHLEALPGEASYFKKWQRCIQVKVLNVISRWIKLQFRDFEQNPILVTRLEAFLNGDVNRAGFTIEADMIKEALDRQSSQSCKSRHSLIIQISKSLVSFGNNNSNGNNTITNSTPAGGLGRRPSLTPSFLSFVSYSTPPASPTHPLYQQHYQHQQDIFLSLNSKDIAKYLTLADFYILKCITAQDFLAMYHSSQKQHREQNQEQINYIAMMTERANKLSKWVLMEITVHKLHSKQRRTVIRKMIEISKVGCNLALYLIELLKLTQACLNWNNFHTSMVITMGLTQLQEFKGGGCSSSGGNGSNGTFGGTEESWQSSSLLPNRDIITFKSLLKYLNVCNNMSYYRNAFKKSAKAPCIPFFPIILKDLTFLMDGNATKKSDGLINFTKFRVLVQSIHAILNYTTENYYFASELDHFPFFPNTSSSNSSLSSASSLPSSSSMLDQVASIMEAQINQQQQQYVTANAV